MLLGSLSYISSRDKLAKNRVLSPSQASQGPSHLRTVQIEMKKASEPVICRKKKIQIRTQMQNQMENWIAGGWELGMGQD